MPQLEAACQILAIQRQLAVDLVERREVVPQQREPLVGDGRVAARAVPSPDAERVGQLQAEALVLVERRRDEALQRARSRWPPRAPARRCLARSASRALTGNTSGVSAEQRAARLSQTKSTTCVELALRSSKMSDLVDDDDDLLAPVADRLAGTRARSR